MGLIRKETVTKANADQVWAALRDIGALHTQLVPGSVVDTQLEPGAADCHLRQKHDHP